MSRSLIGLTFWLILGVGCASGAPANLDASQPADAAPFDAGGGDAADLDADSERDAAPVDAETPADAGDIDAGPITACIERTDCPGVDLACSARACTGMRCEQLSSPPGTPCDYSGGVVCDGSGSCVECASGGDCAEGVCQSNRCVAASCTDSTRNAGETDVDCGGSCAPCANARMCAAPSDCLSGVCTGSRCAPCARDADCDADSFCDDTAVCVPRRMDGEACTTDGQCAAGSECDASAVCSPLCAAGLVKCDGACVDPDSEDAFCGAGPDCLGFTPCASTETCVAGACEVVPSVDPQCTMPYSSLTSGLRTATASGPTLCDVAGSGEVSPDWQGLRWYRFSGAAGTQLATSPPPDDRSTCETSAKGWLNGDLPTVGAGVVTRTACFNFLGDTCWQTRVIRVVNCETFFLYELPDTPHCYIAYCGE